MAYRPRRRRNVRKSRKPRYSRTKLRLRPGRSVRVGTGTAWVKRHTNAIAIRNTSVSGNVIAQGYGGTAVVNSQVQLGTPERDNNYSKPIYNVPFSCQFSLNQVVNYTDFSNLADRYCIKGVAVKARYNQNSIDSSSATATGSAPVIKWIVDHDDSIPQNVFGLQQKMGLTQVMLTSGKFAKKFIRPRTILTAGAGNVVTSAKWFNMAQTDIPHYGLKGYIEGMNLDSTATFDSLVQFEFIYYIGLKDIQ